MAKLTGDPVGAGTTDKGPNVACVGVCHDIAFALVKAPVGDKLVVDQWVGAREFLAETAGAGNLHAEGGGSRCDVRGWFGFAQRCANGGESLGIGYVGAAVVGRFEAEVVERGGVEPSDVAGEDAGGLLAEGSGAVPTGVHSTLVGLAVQDGDGGLVRAVEGQELAADIGGGAGVVGGAFGGDKRWPSHAAGGEGDGCVRPSPGNPGDAMVGVSAVVVVRTEVEARHTDLEVSLGLGAEVDVVVPASRGGSAVGTAVVECDDGVCSTSLGYGNVGHGGGGANVGGSRVGNGRRDRVDGQLEDLPFAGSGQVGGGKVDIESADSTRCTTDKAGLRVDNDADGQTGGAEGGWILGTCDGEDVDIDALRLVAVSGPVYGFDLLVSKGFLVETDVFNPTLPVVGTIVRVPRKPEGGGPIEKTSGDRAGRRLFAVDPSGGSCAVVDQYDMVPDVMRDAGISPSHPCVGDSGIGVGGVPVTVMDIPTRCVVGVVRPEGINAPGTTKDARIVVIVLLGLHPDGDSVLLDGKFGVVVKADAVIATVEVKGFAEKAVLVTRTIFEGAVEVVAGVVDSSGSAAFLEAPPKDHLLEGGRRNIFLPTGRGDQVAVGVKVPSDGGGGGQGLGASDADVDRALNKGFGIVEGDAPVPAVTATATGTPESALGGKRAVVGDIVTTQTDGTSGTRADGCVDGSVGDGSTIC